MARRIFSFDVLKDAFLTSAPHLASVGFAVTSVTVLFDDFAVDNYCADMRSVLEGVAIEEHKVCIFAFFY
jgi:hypothetical protein